MPYMLCVRRPVQGFERRISRQPSFQQAGFHPFNHDCRYGHGLISEDSNGCWELHSSNVWI